jgi:epsilon-lactone hydrolase
MTRIKFSGPLSLRLSSFLALSSIAATTCVTHALARRMEPTWDANFETGILFWRRQFTKAMRQSDIAKGRQILDSLQMETDDIYDVAVELCEQHKGHWIAPATRRTEATLLYFHGGGYTFYGAMSKRFAAMLAHHCGARLFAADYCMTPEHPHPAQAEDALAAWRYVADTTPELQEVSVQRGADECYGQQARNDNRRPIGRSDLDKISARLQRQISEAPMQALPDNKP